MQPSRRVWLAGVAGLLTCAAGLTRAQHGAPVPFPGTFDEHPAIQYANRPAADRVARLNTDLVLGRRVLVPDSRTGYLLPVLQALEVPIESQLLVFSRTGLQRAHTSPSNPRALYFNGSLAVGYIPGAAHLEIASLDPQQGVMFYTVDQFAASGTARFARQTTCLACHLATATLEVPGFIDRSNMVSGDGQVLPALGSQVVDHRTPHTERWGGWFVTGNAAAPPYGPMGHRGNLTVTSHPTSGPAILSDRVLVDWLNRPRDGDRYLASDSDLAALLTFNHQMHGLNLMTRLNWDVRIAEADARAPLQDAAIIARVQELAEYLLFVGEAPMPVAVTPRPGFAEALAARTPRDQQGRSLAALDLQRRLLRYPCSFLVYSDAFAALPPVAREAVYRRIFAILADSSPQYAHLSIVDRIDVAEILRATRTDLPRDLQGPGSSGR